VVVLFEVIIQTLFKNHLVDKLSRFSIAQTDKTSLHPSFNGVRCNKHQTRQDDIETTFFVRIKQYGCCYVAILFPHMSSLL